MSGPLATSFVQRSRVERQAELARLARERHADLGLVLGLTWQVSGHRTHIDYVGGLDSDTIRTRLVKLARSALWAAKSNTTEVSTRGENGRPSLRDELVNVAPVDLNYETTEERKKRSERKYHDFSGILSQIDTAAIASFAFDIMETRRRRTPERSLPLLPFPRVRGPLFGSAHVFYVIELYNMRNRETTRWIIKIPVNGTPDTWDKLCAETLRTEALVLFMLRTETGVPVPAIIDADGSPYNKLHVPYLIMEYVEGPTLDRVWFGEDGEDESKVKQRRTKVLRNLARAMLELGRYEFDRGGAPVFDAGGALVDAGPLRELDVQAMVGRWFRDENCDKGPLYAKVGPFEDPAEMYTALLDLYPCDTEANTGIDRLLRLLVDFIREPSGPKFRDGKRMGEERKRGFVLTHPSLSMRNIVVSKEGDIKAILGWDGVRAAPRSIGNEAFPRWLVRDFNPFVWRWRPAPEFWGAENRSGEKSAGYCYEDAPWVLRELRDEYAEIIQGLKKRGKIIGGDGDGDGDVTRQSLLAISLDTAASDPRCRAAVLRRILEKCSRTSEKFDFDQIVEVLGEGGQLQGYKRKCLEKNLRELVDRGYVRGAVVW